MTGALAVDSGCCVQIDKPQSTEKVSLQELEHLSKIIRDFIPKGITLSFYTKVMLG